MRIFTGNTAQKNVLFFEIEIFIKALPFENGEKLKRTTQYPRSLRFFFRRKAREFIDLTGLKIIWQCLGKLIDMDWEKYRTIKPKVGQGMWLLRKE